jgi:protein ImuB
VLWLGLWFARLPLEVWERAAPAGAGAGGVERLAARRPLRPPSGHALPQGPLLAVCDRLRVLQASDAASALGVHAGMKRATALAIAPDLMLVERDASREQEALRQIAGWALQFTPAVSLQADHGLLLEIEPSLRLFGGRDALLTRLRAGLSELGFGVRVACAPTATGAWLLARHRDGACADDDAQLHARLAALPVALLEAAQPHLDTMTSIGAATLKDLAQLPRAGLARRFGSALLAEIDRAFGRLAEPRLWFEAPATFEARLELLAQVEHAEALLFGARRLILQLTGWLAARHAAVRHFQLRCAHDEPPPTVLTVRLTEASREPDRLTSLLRERLAAARLAAPVHTLQLRCEEVVALPAASASLLPAPGTARESLSRLVERLQARLGREQVQRLLPVADHRPEAAWRVEAVDTLEEPSVTAAAVGGALPRPLWLLARPVAVSERNNRPYWNGPLTLLAGPERIESGWWDGRPVQRDYFIAADEAGALLWLYRERLPDTESRLGWFVQGRFG